MVIFIFVGLQIEIEIDCFAKNKPEKYIPGSTKSILTVELFTLIET